MRLAHQVTAEARKNFEREGEALKFISGMRKIQNDLKIPMASRWMSVPTWFKVVLLEDESLNNYFAFNAELVPPNDGFGRILGYDLYEHCNELGDVIYYGYAPLAQ